MQTKRLCHSVTKYIFYIFYIANVKKTNRFLKRTLNFPLLKDKSKKAECQKMLRKKERERGLAKKV